MNCSTGGSLRERESRSDAPSGTRISRDPGVQAIGKTAPCLPPVPGRRRRATRLRLRRDLPSARSRTPLRPRLRAQASVTSRMDVATGRSAVVDRRREFVAFPRRLNAGRRPATRLRPFRTTASAIKKRELFGGPPVQVRVQAEAWAERSRDAVWSLAPCFLGSGWIRSKSCGVARAFLFRRSGFRQEAFGYAPGALRRRRLVAKPASRSKAKDVLVEVEPVPVPERASLEFGPFQAGPSEERPARRVRR